jgi:excisionase family DNA binding protein
MHDTPNATRGPAVPSPEDRSPVQPDDHDTLLKAVRAAAREGALEALSAADAPRCLSVDAAADALGVSRDTVDTLIHAGELGSLKIGRRRLVPVRALDAYVERRLAEEAEAHASEDGAAWRRGVRR